MSTRPEPRCPTTWSPHWGVHSLRRDGERHHATPFERQRRLIAAEVSASRPIGASQACAWEGASRALLPERRADLPGRGPDDSKVSNSPRPARWDMVDEWGVQSFPASDPPPNW